MTYPGRVHGAYPGNTKTLCGLSTTGQTVVVPNLAPSRVTCPGCLTAIDRQATK